MAVKSVATKPGEPERAASPDVALDDALLRQAATSLRQRTDPRWVEISDRLLANALTATRRSQPVRAVSPDGPVHISEQVLTTYLRAAIDGAVPGSALARVSIDIHGRDTFAGVTIQLIAQFGVELLPVADRVRELARECLVGLLGDVTPTVDVRTMHVHYCDVVPGDPATSDPWTD